MKDQKNKETRMKFTEVKLPTNRKFGFFFTFIFLIAAGYFYKGSFMSAAYGFATLAIVFLLATLVKADILLPLNKLWMRFGLLLGMIVSPIVLGLIFFAMFTPIAFLMRLFRRDELRLKFKKQNTHWIQRDTLMRRDSFKNQF